MAMKLDERKATGPATATPEPPRRRWLRPLGIIAVFILIGAPIMSAGAKLDTIQRNDAEVYLPTNSETTQAIEQGKLFAPIDSTTAVVVYTRPDGGLITQEDKRLVFIVALSMHNQFISDLAAPAAGPIVAEHDGKAVEIVLQFIGTDNNVLKEKVEYLRSNVFNAAGLVKQVAGPAAANADLLLVYSRIDVVLLLVTGIAVLLILILVYRSPILPFVVLAVAGIALELSNGAAYLLGSTGLIPISGEVQGILDVLVLGAGTDYALLLASRFREELRRKEDKYEAMRAALRAAAPAMAASAGTVILGLLCLLVSDLPATRGLGPVAAAGIFMALVSMLVLLPCVLVLLGRKAFWPIRPAYKSKPATTRLNLWTRVAGVVGRHPRRVWVFSTLGLIALALGMLQLQASGVPRTGEFRAPVDSIAAQQVLDEHFAGKAGGPIPVYMKADHLDAVRLAAASVPGISEVKIYVNPLAQFDHQTKGTPAPGPEAIQGISQLQVTMDASPDSKEGQTTVRNLRAAVHGVPGAGALVGGEAAGIVDGQDAASSDRLIVLPLVLLVVFIVLALLLRAILAPLLLIATVVLSFLATMGVCGLVFTDLFGFPGAQTSFPMFAFVFLVALGVDYNIFLMTRVKEETIRKGHRAGTLRGLVVTGGVITSAGIVLAATFASLSVIPLVYLAELSFAVAFGVLLDTFVVRSLLVPALTLDMGPRIWWPNQLQHSTKP